MQYRRPVGCGPSGNTWPRWAPQRAHRASVRTMPWERSDTSSITPGSIGSQKLGQPEPDSNLTSLRNRGVSHTTHR